MNLVQLGVGVQADPDKIEKVEHLPIPTNPEQVRQFLGFAGYYRKFIKNFSKIARPLIDIMAVGKKLEENRECLHLRAIGVKSKTKPSAL